MYKDVGMQVWPRISWLDWFHEKNSPKFTDFGKPDRSCFKSVTKCPKSTGSNCQDFWWNIWFFPWDWSSWVCSKVSHWGTQIARIHGKSYQIKVDVGLLKQEYFLRATSFRKGSQQVLRFFKPILHIFACPWLLSSLAFVKSWSRNLSHRVEFRNKGWLNHLMSPKVDQRICAGPVLS